MITLTTDFGTRESYVAEMKGVALQINPQATFLDISHDIEPQNVAQGAFVLGAAYGAFPRGTIHVAVVDPGVGTARHAILLVTQQGFFLAPDNGLLTYVLRDTPEYQEISRGHSFPELMDVPVPLGWTCFSLTKRSFWRQPVSNTFHGRDIFAPVAAHLSLGVSPRQLGEPVRSLKCLCIPHPQQIGNTISGHVIHIDHFGNLITTIDGEALSKDGVQVEVKGRRIEGVSKSYAEKAGLLAIVGSRGSLEIAFRNGNAARELNARMGDEVVVRLVS